MSFELQVSSFKQSSPTTGNWKLETRNSKLKIEDGKREPEQVRGSLSQQAGACPDSRQAGARQERSAVLAMPGGAGPDRRLLWDVAPGVPAAGIGLAGGRLAPRLHEA